MNAAETDTRFYAAASTLPGAGEGLFAAESLAAGARLLVVGVLVEAGSVADRCTSYADAYKLRAGNWLLIPVGWGAKVNHSRDPNVRKIVERGSVYLEATRPIARGEEIVFTYSGYAAERFALD